MITSWKHGMKHVVSIDQFVSHMKHTTVNAQITHAKRMALRIAKTVKAQIDAGADRQLATHELYMSHLAKKYSVAEPAITYAIESARVLLASM